MSIADTTPPPIARAVDPLAVGPPDERAALGQG